MLPFEEVWRVIGPRSILGRRKAHNLYTLLQQLGYQQDQYQMFLKMA
jgi:hypothetical protein